MPKMESSAFELSLIVSYFQNLPDAKYQFPRSYFAPKFAASVGAKKCPPWPELIMSLNTPRAGVWANLFPRESRGSRR